MLRIIAANLEILISKGDVRFGGFVYMHKITDQRVSGSSLKSLRIFEKICGEVNFEYVVLATSMWNLLPRDGGREIGENRDSALINKDEFFGKMVSGGAITMRDEGGRESAQQIISHITNSSKGRVITASQRKMSSATKTLEETAVGAYLREQMDLAYKRYETELQELNEALVEASRDADENLVSTISEQCRELSQRKEQARRDKEGLQTSKEGLSEAGTEWCSRKQDKRTKKKSEYKDCRARVSDLKRQLKNPNNVENG